MPNFANSLTNNLVLTLTKDPATSEQYKPMGDIWLNAQTHSQMHDARAFL